MNFDAWLTNTSSLSEEATRAVEAWVRISEKPTSIEIRRITSSGSVDVAAQTVRVEYTNNVNTASDQRGNVAYTAKTGLVVFGILDHPTLSDTDILMRDQFDLHDQNCEVVQVVRTKGEIQAICEVR